MVALHPLDNEQSDLRCNAFCKQMVEGVMDAHIDGSGQSGVSTCMLVSGVLGCVT